MVDVRFDPARSQRRTDQFAIIDIVLNVKDRKSAGRGRSSQTGCVGYSSQPAFGLITPVGGWFTTAQKAPTCRTAPTNWAKSTGFTTYALTPRR